MATLREHAARIRREIPIAQVLYDLGYAVRPDGGLREQQFSCDLHGDGRDSKPSARVYPESASFYCFACGLSRDAIALIQAKEGVSFPEAIRKLETRYSLPPLPWADEAPPVATAETTVRARLDPTKTFQEEIKALQSSMLWITQERVIPMEKALAFWDALDQAQYRVEAGTLSEDVGRHVVQAVQERLNQALQEKTK